MHQSCSNEKTPGDLSKQFSLLPASHTGIDFENFLEETENRGFTLYDKGFGRCGKFKPNGSRNAALRCRKRIVLKSVGDGILQPNYK